MSNNNLTPEARANPHAKWLREAAEQFRQLNRYDWANTCEQAAGEINALQAHRDNLLSEHEARLPLPPTPALTPEDIAAWLEVYRTHCEEMGDWTPEDEEMLVAITAQVRTIDKLFADTNGGCSICRATPVVNVEGTYWLCGPCVNERLER